MLVSELDVLAQEIIDCELCPRLRDYCREVAQKKRRMYMDWDYWGRPVPGFGDPKAELLVVGLAPAAHGANRTGRVFTGDRSADWLYRAMHKAGFANQPTSEHRDDGLRLLNAYVTAVVKCAPPANKPTREEKYRCMSHLRRELALLTRVKVIVALGHFAFGALWEIAKERGATGARPAFGHGAVHRLADGFPPVVCSYHPSQQNTQTGVLTEPMFDSVFATARDILES